MATKVLTESSSTPLVVEEDGTIEVVLITPGQGSSGYYSEEMIKSFASETWPKGSHSYVNHLEQGEKRTPEKLIGVLTEDAHWSDEKNGAVSRLKPMKHWEEFVREVAPYTGLSITARGTGRVDTIDGKETYVVESLEPNIMNTVDLVSYAGRGGYFAESLETLYESAIKESTQGNPADGTNEQKVQENMALEEKVETLISTVESLVTAMAASETARKSAEEANATEAANATKAAEATRAVESADLPDSVKAKLHESIAAGDYDVTPKLEEALAIRAELHESLKKEFTESASFGSLSSKTDAEAASLLSEDVKGW